MKRRTKQEEELRLTYIEQIERFCKAGQYIKALEWEMKLIDTFYQEYRLTCIVSYHFVQENINSMRSEKAEANASFLFLQGIILKRTSVYTIAHDPGIYECFSRAAELGHVYALYQQGWMLRHGSGVPQGRDLERGLQLLMRAAEAGCGSAAYWAAYRLSERSTQARYYAMGAVVGGTNCECRLSDLLSKYPLEVAPFSHWKPDLVTQLTVPNTIHWAMWTTLLVFRLRIKQPYHIIYSILFYVCTRNGW